jgi:hypothetical protein
MKDRPAFTVRFDNPDDYDMLRFVAEQHRVSMNQLVQEAIEDRLQREASAMEERLRAALDVVRRYRTEDVEPYADTFAGAEVTELDPVRARAVTQREDRLGVRRAFMRAMERG